MDNSNKDIDRIKEKVDYLSDKVSRLEVSSTYSAERLMAVEKHILEHMSTVETKIDNLEKHKIDPLDRKITNVLKLKWILFGGLLAIVLVSGDTGILGKLLTKLIGA